MSFLTDPIVDENINSHSIAGVMTRLINFLIDTSVFVLLLWGLLFLLQNIMPPEFSRILGFVLFFVYYFLFEWLLHQTIGKMITKTKIVQRTDSNESPTFMQVMLRTVVRVLPVDILSYLFFKNGLHDIVSGTRLISIYPNVNT